MKIELTQARLKDVLHYNPETGMFTRKIGSRGHSAGVLAGSQNPGGYRAVSVDKRKYYAHRLAFLYMTGAWPTGDIDHKDGTKSNNKWENLRDCTRGENQQNLLQARAHNKSGLLGAHLCSRSGKYVSRISLDGKPRYLGTYVTAAEAHAAYCRAKAMVHTHHERLMTNLYGGTPMK